MKTGDTAYLVESNRFIREVEILRCNGDLYIVRFKDSGGGLQVKAHRLFLTAEEAAQNINQAPVYKVQKNPYDYWH